MTGCRILEPSGGVHPSGVHFLPGWERVSMTGHCWATLGCPHQPSLSEAAQCYCVRGCLGVVGLEKRVTFLLNPSQASPRAAWGPPQ